MLLRLLVLVALGTLCSCMFPNTAYMNQNATDNTQVFNGVDTGPSAASGMRLSNLTTDPMASILPGDMSVMFPDTSICDVLLSSSDPISIDQIPFFCLCSHCKTTTGPKGERGDPGLQGFPGSPGRRGLTGFRGPRGYTASLGLKGQLGDQGDKGQPGSIGLTGIKGEQGFKGEKGDNGDDGQSGPLGPQGVPGSCNCQIVIGPPGAQGPPGPAGARGLPGSTGSKGVLGAKGDKGDAGPDGQIGFNGLKGEQGSPGPCNCPDGINGPKGQKGSTGEIGLKGDVGVQGLQGDTGLKGEMGDMGYPGMPGPCTLAVQSAFAVILETPFPEPNSSVKFTGIIYNVQDHYDTNTGIYVAPVNGTYVFTFNSLVKERKLIVGLFINSFSILKMSEYTDTRTVSQEVVLRLTARDMVWLQVKDENSNGMFAGDTMSSTFSGWLLSPDTCDFGANRDFLTKPNITNVSFTWN